MTDRGVKSPLKFRLGLLPCSEHTIPELLDEIRQLLSDRALQPRTLLCVNAHIYNLAHGDSDLLSILHEARVVAADGMSIVWTARLFGSKIKERCNMTEAFRAFLVDPGFPPSKAILVGLADEELPTAIQRIESLSPHCRIVGHISGYADEKSYEQKLKECGDVDFIFLGMGTPKSERISRLANRACPRAIVWHIGGGTLKILCGMIKEAPRPLRKAGLQWVYRLFSEPRTLWRRYLIGNPVFVYRILRERWHQGSSSNRLAGSK